MFKVIYTANKPGDHKLLLCKIILIYVKQLCSKNQEYLLLSLESEKLFSKNSLKTSGNILNNYPHV